METVRENSTSALSRGDIFVDLSPRSLFDRKLEALNACYSILLREGAVPEVQRDVEKLWTIFDAALESEHIEFLYRYLEEICFSPELIPFSSDAYFHSTYVILDWCQKFHSDAEGQILEFRHDTLMHLPQKCENMTGVLTHCLSHQEGDQERRERRSVMVQKLLKRTEGMRLAACVACWRRCHDTSLAVKREHLASLTPDCYLCSQGLPPMWLEHYPFQDENKMMEIVFLNKDDLNNPQLMHSKLAILAFYLLHSGQVSSLEFLTEYFEIDRLRAKLWQGLFLVDLCLLEQPYFETKEIIEFAAQSLRDSVYELKAMLPFDTMMKLVALGCGADVRSMFIKHLSSYLDAFSCPVSVARQGLLFCLTSGDVSAGVLVVRKTLQRLHTQKDGILLLHYFFDQCLGSSLLENLVMQDLTGMEETVFIDWAGNKRDDPECSLYLALYLFRQSRLEAAKKLYLLNADKMRHSTNQDLWKQLAKGLKNVSISATIEPAFERSSATEESDNSDISVDEDAESDGDTDALITVCCSMLPSYLQHLLKKMDRAIPQLVSTYSELLNSKNFCPLQPPEEEDRPPIKTHSAMQNGSTGQINIECVSDDDIFYDAMESLEE